MFSYLNALSLDTHEFIPMGSALKKIPGIVIIDQSGKRKTYRKTRKEVLTLHMQ